MARKKVKLAFITNNASRKATFNKRKKGLLKKVNELSTLCGVNACAIIYSPYDSNPEVWPSNSGVERIVSEFRALPEMDQQKKMVDHVTFLRQRIAKESDHLRRQMKENRELEMTEVMVQCMKGNMGRFRMNIMDLNDLGFLIDQYLKDDRKIKNEISKNSGNEIGESSNAAGAVWTTTFGRTGSMEIGESSNAAGAFGTTTFGRTGMEIGASSNAAGAFGTTTFGRTGMEIGASSNAAGAFGTTTFGRTGMEIGASSNAAGAFGTTTFGRTGAMEIGESFNAAGAFGMTNFARTGSMEIMASTTPPTTTTNDQTGFSSSPLAAFLNPLQQQHHQQFRYPSSPHVGLFEHSPSLDLNLNQNYSQNQQQWFMEMTHHQPEPFNYADNDQQRGFLFMDDNHQPQHQHDQQILGDSSTVSTGATTSSTIPVTNPSPTNNTWFR